MMDERGGRHGSGCKPSYNVRLAIGLLIAGLLLVAFCRAGEWYVESACGRMLEDVLPLAASIENESWEVAGEQRDELVEHWRRVRRVLLGLLSHREVWNIDEVLIGMSAYLDGQQREDALERLALVEYYLERSVGAEEINWSNFF